MSNNTARVEVFSGIQRRRRYSVDQKLAVLAEAAQPGMSISYVARRPPRPCSLRWNTSPIEIIRCAGKESPAASPWVSLKQSRDKFFRARPRKMQVAIASWRPASDCGAIVRFDEKP
jgi:hypothetical protein